MNKTQSLVIA